MADTDTKPGKLDDQERLSHRYPRAQCRKSRPFTRACLGPSSIRTARRHARLCRS
jgi:hypothetical protein